MDRFARGFLGWAGRHTPPERREWLAAMAAELEVVPGGPARLLWALGGLSLVSFGRRNPVTRSWWSWPAALRVSAFGLVLSAVLLVGIVWSNVIVPSHQSDDEYTLWYAVFYACLPLYFAAAGLFAARGRRSLLWGVAGGAVTALLLVVIVVTTFTIIDNVFLDIVMTQPDKAAGFARSGLRDPRAYVNQGLLAGILLILPFFTAVGAGCGLVGALLERRLRPLLPTTT
jgi:hypothetical protein